MQQIILRSGRKVIDPLTHWGGSRVPTFAYPYAKTRLVLLGILVFFPAAPSQATLPFGQTTLAPMLEKIIPGVVNIATRSKLRRQNNPLLSDPFFRHFFDLPDTPQRQPQSLGSGIIVDARRGLVLTNHHVIDNADQILITLFQP